MAVSKVRLVCYIDDVVASMCTAADDRLFAQVTGNTQHLLHDLLQQQYFQTMCQPPRTKLLD